MARFISHEHGIFHRSEAFLQVGKLMFGVWAVTAAAITARDDSSFVRLPISAGHEIRYRSHANVVMLLVGFGRSTINFRYAPSRPAVRPNFATPLLPPTDESQLKRGRRNPAALYSCAEVAVEKSQDSKKKPNRLSEAQAHWEARRESSVDLSVSTVGVFRRFFFQSPYGKTDGFCGGGAKSMESMPQLTILLGFV